MIVIGSRFKPGEHLSVTLIADGTRTKVGIASAKGLLNLSFGALALSNCSAYTLKITGNKGSTFKKVKPHFHAERSVMKVGPGRMRPEPHSSVPPSRPSSSGWWAAHGRRRRARRVSTR